MLYRRFGRTGIQMPVFSTGGMRYQDGWQDKPLDQIDPRTTDNMRAIIARSLELGIPHIETAKGYGPSERQLGVVLSEHPRDAFILQTKGGPTETGKEFRVRFEQQCERLQTDRIDLYGMHGINTFELLERTVRPGGCLEEARRLQEQGRLGHVGFSTHAPLPVILETIRSEAFGGFDYVNLHWYFIFQRNAPAIAEANARDMGVFVISPTDKGGRLQDPSPEMTRLCAPLHPIVFNDLWCLRQQGHGGVDTLSLGAARPSDYDLHLEAVGHMERGDAHVDALIDPIVQKLGDAMEAATGHRDPEHQVYDGVPEYYDNEHGLHASVMLWLRNVALGWGLTEYGRSRFGMLGKADHYFPGIGGKEAASISDDQLLELFRDSPARDELPARLRDSIARLDGVEGKRLSSA